jgi:glycosyltransferase involved in cell wall biosynthesis
LFPEWRRPYLETAFHDADCVMAVSRSLAEAISPWILDREDVVEIVPNMVDTSFFDLPAVPRAAGCFGILCVALLNANKRVDVLIRSFAKAFSDDPTVALEVGGDGPERRSLESLAQELGISARVRFLGLLDRTQVRSAMQRNHLFVLPSAKETFGLVCVEALACGLPVIATMSGGPEEIVSDEVGWLVEPGNVEMLAEAMRGARALGGPDASRSRRLRLYANDRFGSVAIARRLASIYADAVGSSRISARTGCPKR